MPISESLTETIKDFFHPDEGDAYPLAVRFLASGSGNPEFQREFSRAIRSGDVTPTLWAEATQTQEVSAEALDKRLRYIWSILFPDDPYPTSPEVTRIPIDVASRELNLQLAETGLAGDRLRQYLNDAAVILAGRGLLRDRVDSDGAAIAMAFRSDGVWAWSEELTAYVERYNLSLPLPFLHRVRNAQGRPHQPTSEEEAVALAAIRGGES